MNNIEEEIIFKLIASSGSARSCVFEALCYSKEGEYEKVNEAINEGKKYLVEAHNVQTSMIQQEAQGISKQVNLLMVHAQDHLMTTILANDLIEEMIYMQKELNELKQELKTLKER